MNGKYQFVDAPPSLMVKSIAQIKRTADRIVFIDEGVLSPDSFAVYYNKNTWFDPPMMRHANGTNASFADGHTGRLMWRAEETILAGKDVEIGYAPTTCAGKNDLYNVQVHCWGRIGYPTDEACKYALDDW